MVAAHRPKPLDKQEICRKITTLLKKYYPPPVRKELPVLETLLFAVCLEGSTLEQAESLYAGLYNGFHDLNEVRVSSISELQVVFKAADEPEWRAHRVRSALQYVFETNYAFDFESLKRKTGDLAAKQLQKISGLSAFVRAYVMQHCLGSHVLPIDARMHAALVWLGLVERDSTPEHDGEALRPFIRKADATLFCHLLGCLANDPKRSRVFAAALSKTADQAAADPVGRLEQLLKRGDSGPARTKRHKPAAGRSARATNHNPRADRNKLGSKKRH